jgi:flavodoxin
MRMTATPIRPGTGAMPPPLVDSAALLRQPVLVVCYSRSGRTRSLARQIAEQCGADFEEIELAGRRRGLIGWLRCALEALTGRVPKIRASRRPPSNYDTVVVGTPVWGWRMASPVRAYLQRHRGQVRRVACFCTYGRLGAGRVPEDLARLCGRHAAATLALSAAELSGRRYWGKVSRFVRIVRSGQRQRRPVAQRAAA